jgi:hypothetical protein
MSATLTADPADPDPADPDPADLDPVDLADRAEPAAPTDGSTGGRRRRGWLPWAAGLAGLLVIALALGAPHTASTDDLDPHATDGSGTKALVLLLGQSGAHVQVTDRMPGPDTDVALLASDTTSQAQTSVLEGWVRAGGVLVVADPESSFVPVGAVSAGSPFGLASPPVSPGDCDIDALSGLDRVWPSSDPAFFDVPAGSSRCYTSGIRAFVVDTPLGRGHIVAVASPFVFTNNALDQYDNAGLATDLLAPRVGTRVSVLWGMDPGTDGGAGGHQQDLGSLVSVGVKLALLELLVAFLIYAWFRARRLGQPVAEPQLVQIGGSELIRAHGDLLAQTRDPDRAARLLRADLRRRLAERLGLSPDASPEVVAEVTASRAGVDRDRVARAVTDIPVRSEAELLDLARDIDSIRAEVLHGTAP